VTIILVNFRIETDLLFSAKKGTYFFIYEALDILPRVCYNIFILFFREVYLMSKTSSAVKRKYNKGEYRRYEFSVGLDKKLNYCLEEFKGKGGNVSELIKTTLAAHFNVDPDENFFPYKYDNGKTIKVEELK
jgi:hypothetical protein